MKILQTTHENQPSVLQEAVAMLRAGGVVIYPTETTYGIAVDVENPMAVQKLLDYKGKRDGKPISVAVCDATMAQRYVIPNSTARHVYATFLPGPVTVISTGTGTTAPGIASRDGKVGIRIPAHDLALELIRTYGSGISATGANASNQKRPYAIQDILDHTTQKQKDLIDLIIDVGELAHNEPSTVIDTTVDDIVVLRQGKAQFVPTAESVSYSVDATIAWFEDFSKRFRSYFTYKPVLFLFSGEMGVGKTHAVKGIARGLGILTAITSPTYTYANEYSYLSESRSGRFVHMDCWRMQSFAELLDIGLESYLATHAVIAIEWSERFTDQLIRAASSAVIVRVHMNPGEGEQTRIIAYAVESL